MKWIGISGSWRYSNPELRADVRASVADIMQRGDGIVSGGALGVDQVATEEALLHDKDAKHLRIIIPSTLETYAQHYRTRANEGVITQERADALIGLLMQIKSKNALTEMGFTELNVESYYARNTAVLEASDELLVFQVNGSAGVQDAADKARELGMPVLMKYYEITSSH